MLGEKDLRLIKDFKMPVSFSSYYVRAWSRAESVVCLNPPFSIQASTRVLVVCREVKGGRAKLESFFFKQDFVMKLPNFEIILPNEGASFTTDNLTLCRL